MKISSLFFFSAACLSLTSDLPAITEATPSEAILHLEKELLALEEELILPEERASLTQENPEPIDTHTLLMEDDPDASPILEMGAEESPLPSPASEEITIAPSLETESTSQAVPLLSANEMTETSLPPLTMHISLQQVFAASPIIYSSLLTMSFFAFAICLYALIRISEQNKALTLSASKLQETLTQEGAQAAYELCQKNSTLLSKVVACGLASRKHGLPAILEGMKAEGRRASISSWQQLGILQDIAVIAPMLGLLGTVVGLFYAFYDLHRSLDSINMLLDGLGISVGTTVAGIAVAILALLLYSTTKFRLVRVLAKVEVEASRIAHLMDVKE